MSSMSNRFSNAKVCSLMVGSLAFAFAVSSLVVAQEESAKPESAQPAVSQAQAESPQQAETNSVTLATVLEKYRQRGEKEWEEKIQKLEARNAKEGAWPRESLLFYGSSSFRRWETLNVDMVPFPAINRGYGGAKYVDMVLFAQRMLTPHNYRALMLFAANDVKGKDDDSSPEEVECAVREIIRVSQAHRPDAPIFIVEVTPTESRWNSWEQTRAVNATLRDIALTTDNTWFIATAQHYLNADDTPKTEYFVDDKLHLNEQGYKKWAQLIKFQLNSFLPSMK